MIEAADVIMSVRGHYADAILVGEKTVELRRRFPGIALGTRLWIYETLPKGAVVGFVTVRGIEKATPAAIWRRYKGNVCVDDATFFDYFRDTSEAMAILLSAACRVSPITIQQLRCIRDRFHPPQVATRLTLAETLALRAIAREVAGPRPLERNPRLADQEGRSVGPRSGTPPRTGRGSID